MRPSKKLSVKFRHFTFHLFYEESEIVPGMIWGFHFSIYYFWEHSLRFLSSYFVFELVINFVFFRQQWVFLLIIVHFDVAFNAGGKNILFSKYCYKYFSVEKTQVKHEASGKIVSFWDVDKDKIPEYHCEESDKVDGVSWTIGFHYVHKYFYAMAVFS